MEDLSAPGVNNLLEQYYSGSIFRNASDMLSARKQNRSKNTKHLKKMRKQDTYFENRPLHNRNVSYGKQIASYLVPGLLLFMGILVVIYSLKAQKS